MTAAQMLKTKGIIQSAISVDVAPINDYLVDKVQYNGHVRRGSDPTLAGPNSNESCYSMEDCLLAPILLECSLPLRKLFEEYFETKKIYLYSINIFNTFPIGGNTNPYLQEFHTDHDDVNFLAMFIYLSDILTVEDGPHQFGLDTIMGRAGTCFIEDGRRNHRGIKPTSRPRRLAWIRWGVSNPPHTYVQDGIQPINRALLGERYSRLSNDDKESLQLLVK